MYQSILYTLNFFLPNLARLSRSIQKKINSDFFCEMQSAKQMIITNGNLRIKSRMLSQRETLTGKS